MPMIQKIEQGRIVKVSPAVSLAVPPKISPLKVIDASDCDASHEIEEEKRIKLVEDMHRYNIYKDILLGNPDDNWHYYHAFYGMITIVLSNLLCGIITVIPMHNVILEPFYWYTYNRYTM